MTDIGFSLQTQYDRPMHQVIALLKESGFSSVSPLWSPEYDLKTLANCVYAHKMTIQSLHAPHKGIASLWHPDSPESIQVQSNILACLNACKEFDVPIMVIHGWQGLSYTFPETPLNFRFFDRMMEQAGALDIAVAFENLEGEEYLQALMERYPQAGFCWDSGHDHCYPHKTDFLESFGHRLIMTHLNDNLGLRDPGGIPSGVDDLHFLPYDGNINWSAAIPKLKRAARQEILNFELKVQSQSKNPADLIYNRLSLDEFIPTAGHRARQLAELYDA